MMPAVHARRVWAICAGVVTLRGVRASGIPAGDVETVPDLRLLCSQCVSCEFIYMLTVFTIHPVYVCMAFDVLETVYGLRF